MIYKQKKHPDIVEMLQQRMREDLAEIEIKLSRQKHIASEEISIADLILSCELIQARFLDMDLKEYPRIYEYV